MPADSLVDNVTKAFKDRFQREPKWLVAAPGRVNLIGEHTDYNAGFVLPMAIDRYFVVAADATSPNPGSVITWRADDLQEEFTMDASQPMTKESPTWSNYIRGVLAGFQDRNIPVNGIDAVMGSSVPVGGGLSSSAALEVATATLLECVSGRELDPVDKALLCQKAEHEYANVPCGIMDQFISVMGKKDNLLLIDCRSNEAELVPMDASSLEILIFNTNVKHELSGGEYAERRADCEQAAKALGVPALRDATQETLDAAKDTLSPVVYRRARHVIGEIERTTQAAAAVRAGDWKQVGELMYASHDSLRDDFEVSCPELDTVVEIAREIGVDGGVHGCRMTGGGFGGCNVALIEAASVDAISAKLVEDYSRKTGIEPSVFVSRPAQGATVIKS
jgi:galactokinase